MRASPVLAALLLVCVAVVGGVTPLAGTVRPDAPARNAAAVGTGTVGASVPGVAADADGNATPAADSSGVDAPLPPTDASVADPVPVAAVNATNVTGTVNVSRVLWLPSGATPVTRMDSVTIDAGVAVSFGTNRSAERMETIAVRERVRSADGAEARSQAILDGMNAVERRAVTLRTRSRSTVRSYANGELTATDLVVERARIRAEAGALANRVRLLSTLAEDVEGFSLNTGRTQSLLYDLETFGGPVTDRAVAALRGSGDATRLYVSATGTNVVVTTVTDGEYVRETYRGDLRNLDGSSIQPAVAQAVTARSYPEIWDARTATSGSGRGGTFIYRVAYPGGQLTAFVDGGSERVFEEHQRINLTTFPSTTVANNTQNGLTLSVNRSYAGGPIRLELTDASTGEPVDGTVQLGRGEDSTTVGRTGEDGVLWALSPRGTYYVTAVEIGTPNAVIVETSPVEPETVADTFDASEVGDNGTATTPTSGGTQ
ncbi:DUF7094 domain-containing protein [Candidatus Halobonum tyrrellensis]|uniref:Uncharacterized protein n=1 Tax=Candidatus Halobonum tyrrellensis G22 TaxID=1324957 RepID=V4J1J2_9EURY|nr:hypothetical protein [Candidatus Halobonum tyrrellensis]ESP89292.1 hypothetical protein K933_04721 [Candidatus Halobonum tyrrellensis G22]